MKLKNIYYNVYINKVFEDVTQGHEFSWWVLFRSLIIQQVLVFSMVAITFFIIEGVLFAFGIDNTIFKFLTHLHSFYYILMGLFALFLFISLFSLGFMFSIRYIKVKYNIDINKVFENVEQNQKFSWLILLRNSIIFSILTTVLIGLAGILVEGMLLSFGVIKASLIFNLMNTLFYLFLILVFVSLIIPLCIRYMTYKIHSPLISSFINTFMGSLFFIFILDAISFLDGSGAYLLVKNNIIYFIMFFLVMFSFTLNKYKKKLNNKKI